MNTSSQQDSVFIERALATQRPFGHAQHINTLVERLYMKRLEYSKTKIPLASELLTVLETVPDQYRYRILRDSIFRVGIDQAFLYSNDLKTHDGREWIENLFQQALVLVNDKTTLIEHIHQKLSKPALEPLVPLIWDGSINNVYSNCIERVVHKCVPESNIDSPTQQHISTLSEAITLLQNILPQLTTSILSHVVTIVLVSDQNQPGSGHSYFHSGTSSHIPGVMIVSTKKFDTVWGLAETLLHEALHLKFIDVEFTHTMDPIKAEDRESWKIQPPWHQFTSDNEGWPPVRTMTAAHVYLGLALLFECTRQKSNLPATTTAPTKESLQDASFICIERATWLLDSVDEYSEKLGLAGQRFVCWLKNLAITYQETLAA